MVAKPTTAVDHACLGWNYAFDPYRHRSRGAAHCTTTANNKRGACTTWRLIPAGNTSRPRRGPRCRQPTAFDTNRDSDSVAHPNFDALGYCPEILWQWADVAKNLCGQQIQDWA